MPTIEIDFETFKHLTMRRNSEDHSYNEVVRELLGLPLSKDDNNGAAALRTGATLTALLAGAGCFLTGLSMLGL